MLCPSPPQATAHLSAGDRRNRVIGRSFGGHTSQSISRVVHSNHEIAHRDAIAGAGTTSRADSKPEARCNTLEPEHSNLAAHNNRPTHRKRERPDIRPAGIPKVPLTRQPVAA